MYVDAAALAGEAGDVKCSNLVVVGALSKGLTLPLEAWQQANRQAAKPRFVEVDLRAFEAGRRHDSAARPSVENRCVAGEACNADGNVLSRSSSLITAHLPGGSSRFY